MPPDPSLHDATAKRGLTDISLHPILVSFFASAAARRVSVKELTLIELAEVIKSVTARIKGDLPWLKGARFGDVRSVPGNSLRHDANVIGWTLANLDYDQGRVSFEEAIERVRNAGLRALLYTSPSYTLERPRWRALLPTSRELPPDQYNGLSRAAAARLGVEFGRESFTLSQAFFYGTAVEIETSDGVLTDGTPVKVEVVDGTYIDLAGLQPWTEGERLTRGPGLSLRNRAPADRDEVELALSVIDADPYFDWLAVGAGLWDEYGEDGEEIFDKWSQKSHKYDRRKVERKWKDCQQMTQYTIGTVFHFANVASPDWRQRRRGTDGRVVLDAGDPMRSARAIYQDRYLTTDGKNILVRHRGEFLKWNGACYQINSNEAQRGEIWRFLDKAQVAGRDGQLLPFRPKRDNVTNVHEALGAICALGDYVEPPEWIGDEPPVAPPKEFFAASNGLLHLPTRTLYNPTPSFFGVTASDVAYDPVAAEPVQWLAYLQQTVADDQAICALQEWMGYTLGGDTAQQKILFCIGPKRSGKGTFARMHTALLGKDSVGGPPMSAFGTQFGLANLITKSLAIVSDARIGKKTDRAAITERLLTISGEDTIDIDRKYGTMWTGRLPTRINILTNELPTFSEGSGALAGRLLVIMFQHSFYGREDPGLTDRLMTELPGILNWAIEGYKRLQSRGHFVQPMNALEQIEAIERLGNPVKAFVLDRCVIGVAREIEADELYDDWCVWCAEHGGEPGNKDWFGRNLRSAVPGLTTARSGIKDANGRRRLVYRGLSADAPDPMMVGACHLLRAARRSSPS